MADKAPPNHWTEEDSHLYQQIAPVAVPARAEQIAALLTLLPFSPNDSFRAVEVGCGEGYLAQALLTCFPNAAITALDGSAEMRAKTAERLQRFGSRFNIEPFNLASPAWRAHLRQADCALSSLVIHHLSGPAKRQLFQVIYHQLSARGALFIADLVEPQHPQAAELFAAAWDRSAQAQSLAETGSTGLFEKFKQVEWNLYRYPDPVDQPSSLFEQLLWLKEAGFAIVDCFWLQAGHAIYGGYKNGGTFASPGLRFEVALEAVRI
jgi:tRNA (cmo5U34)-methyltransferase